MLVDCCCGTLVSDIHHNLHVVTGVWRTHWTPIARSWVHFRHQRERNHYCVVFCHEFSANAINSEKVHTLGQSRTVLNQIFHSCNLGNQECRPPPHHPTGKGWFLNALPNMILNGFLEGEVDGIVGILIVVQQITSRLHVQNFDSHVELYFPLIHLLYSFVLFFAVMLNIVRIWNEENGSRGRCNYFRHTRTITAIPEPPPKDICLPVGKCHNIVRYYFNHELKPQDSNCRVLQRPS